MIVYIFDSIQLLNDSQVLTNQRFLYASNGIRELKR